MYASGVCYEDLVASVDVVVTKPGFGIVTECLANDTAMLYTSRGRFVEYDVMVAEMPRFLRCALHRAGVVAGRPLARGAHPGAGASPGAGAAADGRRGGRRGDDRERLEL